MVEVSSLQVKPGKDRPLGANWSGQGVNFSVFSQHAAQVELCLFDARGQTELLRIPLIYKTGFHWHCYIEGLKPGQQYGYRVYGAYEPENGHRFNGHKVLIDPYAKKISTEVIWDDCLYSYMIEDGNTRSFSKEDSSPVVPKSVVVETDFDWEGIEKPNTPLNRTVVYEAHVKGLTQRHPNVPEEHRGTYLGLTYPCVIDYLKELGISAVELLPVHGFFDERMLYEKNLTNYWGYNSIAFFAPTERYAFKEPVREFKEMVKALHKAGIEVILDVVYNHSCEGNEYGPTFSFRGLDNLSYYRLTAKSAEYYENYSGCGNTINVDHPSVIKMIIDSLRYWTDEMQVDGFRFDLAPILGRDRGEYTPGAALFDAINQDPVLSQTKMIGEPWDLGPNGYQVGNFPMGWSEWNDKFRDTMRAFWKGDGGILGDVAERIAGSAQQFRHSGRGPFASVNFISAHDGFTLYDVVSYNEKHNEANLEGNRDGHSHNLSWNCGEEGPTKDEEIFALRIRQHKNMLVTLFLSQGIPMLLAGDEVARTQNGNNNAYCQDNELNWHDWDFKDHHKEILDFTKKLISIIKRHRVFKQSVYLDGVKHPASNYKDVSWLHSNGEEITHEVWFDGKTHALGVLLAGDSLREFDSKGDVIEDNNFVLLLNPKNESVAFRLPAPHYSTAWALLFDTAETEYREVPTTLDAREQRRIKSCYGGGHVYHLQPYSSALFIEVDD